MKKKMIIAAVFVAAIAITASVAFAHGENGCCFPVRKACCPDVKVNTSNLVQLKNSVWAVANTGFNRITNDKCCDPCENDCQNPCRRNYGSANIETGDATAINDVRNYVTADVSVKAPYRGKLEVTTKNDANIENHVGAIANTGFNSISAKKGNIETGDAGAQNGVVNMVDAKVNVY
jgi:hypothetical protein